MKKVEELVLKMRPLLGDYPIKSEIIACFILAKYVERSEVEKLKFPIEASTPLSIDISEIYRFNKKLDQLLKGDG